MKLNRPILIILVFLVLVGCYPQLDSSIADADTAVTFFDKELRDSDGYQNYKTFILPDTVLHIIDEENPENNIELSRAYDEQIISDIRRNMVSLGYTEINIADVTESNLPDLVLFVEAVGLRTWVQSVHCWPPSWGWGGWWGYWPGYGGWGGCGTSLSSYTTGTLYINMIDPERFDTETDTPEVNQAAIWIGTINGGLSSSSNTPARIKGLIDRSFEQSPYLQQN